MLEGKSAVVLLLDAGAVVADLDEVGAVVFKLDLDGSGAGVGRVYGGELAAIILSPPYSTFVPTRSSLPGEPPSPDTRPSPRNSPASRALSPRRCLRH